MKTGLYTDIIINLYYIKNNTINYKIINGGIIMEWCINDCENCPHRQSCNVDYEEE